MKIHPSTARRKEAGDTLIEVTIALSILSMVLMSSSVIATRAFRLGQTARERTEVADEAEGQMEAVRAFRDNNTWDHFLNGESGATPFQGIVNAGQAGANCQKSSTCFHMTGGSAPTFLPVNDRMSGSIPSSYIETTAVGPTAAQPNTVEVTVSYYWDGLGGGNNVGHITTDFTNLQYVAAPPPPPPIPPTPTPPVLPVYVNCAQAAGETYFMNLWDYQGSDWHVNYVQPGIPAHPNSTISFPQYIPAGDYAYWAVSKDAAGVLGQSLHYLFYSAPSPTVGVDTPIAQTVNTPDLATSGVQAAIGGMVTFSSDVRSIMVQHAAQIPSPDDGVDAACLALRPIP